MPISKEKKSLYPHDWKEISRRVRFTRAEGQCEFMLGSVRCPARHGQLHPITGKKVVLTTAHLDGDPTNNSEENLRAGCQRCHLRHDIPQHVATRKANRRKAKNTLEMFPAA